MYAIPIELNVSYSKSNYEVIPLRDTKADMY